MINRNFNVSVDWSEFETPKKIKRTNPNKKRTIITDTSLDYYFSEAFKKAMAAKTPHLKMYESDNLRDYIYFETLHFLYQNKNEYFFPREIKNFILTNKKLLKIKNINNFVDFCLESLLCCLKNNKLVLTKLFSNSRKTKAINSKIRNVKYSCSSKFDILLENDILNNEKFRQLFFNKKLFTLKKVNDILQLLKDNKFSTVTELNKKLYYFCWTKSLSMRYLTKLVKAGIVNKKRGRTQVYWCNF